VACGQIASIARCTAASVARAPRTHVVLQLDLRSSADGGDKQIFGAE
jgi:hypothetical protein